MLMPTSNKHRLTSAATINGMTYLIKPCRGLHLAFLLTTVCLTLPLLAAETTASPSNNTEADYAAKIEYNDAQIAKLRQEVEDTARQRKALLAKLEQAQSAGNRREQRVQSLQNDIASYETRVDNLEQQVTSTLTLLANARQRLKRVIQKSQQTRANTGLQVMLQHDDATLANRLGVYYDYFFRAQTALVKKTTAQLASVRDAHSEALKSRNWLLHLKRKASGQRADHAAAEAASRAGIKQADDNLAAKQQSVESLKSEQAQLARLMEELRKNSLGASGQFSAHKGRYPWPVKGKLGVRFGETKAVGKLKWSGIIIESAAGNVVKTIADGEVVYADWLQGFGMLVILDHGDNYMTLYGGNRDLSVHAGDWVEFGATIATVGDSVGLKRPGLYFEIRHNAKPVNPETWINLKNQFDSADK